MTAPSAVQALADEFDGLAESGRTVAFWWRDDDAVRWTPALDRLLAVARETAVPLALAAVPDRCEPSLAEALTGRMDVSVLVHGWRHLNHAPSGDKSAEFGPHRPIGVLAEEARAGLARIAAEFGPRALPVFVPPWNRIAPDLAAALPLLGYRGLSASGRARTERSRDKFVRLDTHLDPVAWRDGRGLAHPAAQAATVRRALREGATAIGLLTHHLVFDDDHWAFLEGCLDLVARHPAVQPRSLSDLMDGTGGLASSFDGGRPASCATMAARAEADA